MEYENSCLNAHVACPIMCLCVVCLQVFTPEDRGSLLDDAFALAGAGHISITIPLEMTKYLHAEKHYVPWRVAVENLEAIRILMVEKPSHNHIAVCSPRHNRMAFPGN